MTIAFSDAPRGRLKQAAPMGLVCLQIHNHELFALFKAPQKIMLTIFKNLGNFVNRKR
jgi:hypothetical protein